MRALKFRAWDGKEMKPAFDLTQNPKYWWEEMKDFPLMQFTGLNDKNGVEIYGGDILRLKLVDYAGLDKPDIFAVVNNEVFYSDVCYLQQIDDHIKQNETNDYVEIIGNIFTNPELLEVPE